MGLHGGGGGSAELCIVFLTSHLEPHRTNYYLEHYYASYLIRGYFLTGIAEEVPNVLFIIHSADIILYWVSGINNIPTEDVGDRTYLGYLKVSGALLGTLPRKLPLQRTITSLSPAPLGIQSLPDYSPIKCSSECTIQNEKFPRDTDTVTSKNSLCLQALYC